MIILYIGVLYIIGILLFLEMTWSTGKDITSKEARKSLLWFIFATCWFIKIIIWSLCNLLTFFFLLFGYCKYKDSKFYQFINNLVD